MERGSGAQHPAGKFQMLLLGVEACLGTQRLGNHRTHQCNSSCNSEKVDNWQHT